MSSDQFSAICCVERHVEEPSGGNLDGIKVTGRSIAENRPSSLVVSVRTAPVDSFFKATLAFGTDLPA